MNLTAGELVGKIEKALADTTADIKYHGHHAENYRNLGQRAIATGDYVAAESHRALANDSTTAMNEAMRAASRLIQILADAGVTKGGGQ